MNQERLLVLAARRGELTARIAAQRGILGRQLRPLAAVLSTGDKVAAAGGWLKRHPGAVAAAAAVLAILRPRRAWHWAKRGLFLWRGWQALRAKLAA